MAFVAAVEGVIGSPLWSVFTAKAEAVGAAVMRTASQDTAAVLLGEATDTFVCTAKVARRLPVLAARGARAAPTPAAEVVALAEFAIAETGSIALDEPAPDRGACFLAERLWLLIAEKRSWPRSTWECSACATWSALVLGIRC